MPASSPAARRSKSPSRPIELGCTYLFPKPRDGDQTLRMQLLKDVFLLKSEDNVYLAARRGDIVESRTLVELGRENYYHRSSGGLHPVGRPSPSLTPAPCGAQAVRLKDGLFDQHKSILVKSGEVVLVVGIQNDEGIAVDALTLTAKYSNASIPEPFWQRQQDASNSVIYPTGLTTTLISDVAPLIGLALPPPIAQGARIVGKLNTSASVGLWFLSDSEARKKIKADEPRTQVGKAASKVEKASNRLGLVATVGSTGMYVGSWLGFGLASTLSGGIVPVALLGVSVGTAALTTVSHQVKRRAG